MIRGNKRVVEKNVTLEHRLHNRFDLEVRDARTGEVRQTAQAFNIVLDQFWTRLFAGQSVYDYIQYGSGSGTPAATDTALFDYVGGAAAGASTYDDAHYAEGWNSFTRSIVLDELTAVGETLTEVGLAGAANSALVTHAMLQDMNGNPISITKTDTDIITIYATVYIHWNVNGSNGVFYNPRSHWFGTRNSLEYWWIGKGVGALDTQVSRDTTVQGDALSKSWTWGPIRLPVGQANIGGLGSIEKATGERTGTVWVADVRGAYQVTNESLGTGDGETTDFFTAFDSPYDVEVYVDGVRANNIQLSFSDSFILSAMILDPQSTDSQHVLAVRSPLAGNGDQIDMYVADYLDQVPLGTFVRPNLANGGNFSYSDDLISWSEPVALHGHMTPLPQDFLGHKYIRIVGTSSSSGMALGIGNKNKIIFSTPPAAGAVITANYKTPFVPKDENHVYDISVTITLGEYSE